MEDVIAVIVTYNRLALLREAVKSVGSQTYAVKQIIVVNNGCTDGTTEWLAERKDIIAVHHSENIGASGGFQSGIRRAASFNTPWIWLMDDDTFCEEETLEQLIKCIPNIDQKIGFIGSKCRWNDGEPHLMNVPDIKPRFNKTIPFNNYDQFDLLLTESNSWVSLLVNTRAVKEVGLPYKEFFFWSDDLEYTQRISKAGYLGLYCMKSTVLHKTSVNYCPDFYKETVGNVWKHKYGFRNEFFLKRKNNGPVYFAFWLLAKVGYTSYKVAKIRTDNRAKFIGVLLLAAWNSIFFNPKIERLGERVG